MSDHGSPTGRFSRRSFLAGAAAAGLSFPAIATGLRASPPSGKVRHAGIGAGGMGGADLGQITAHPEVNLVAIADVDLGKTAALKKKHPDLRVYQDWRQLLEKEARNLDTVSVSTPDHMHAAPAMAAMQLGLHVYVQKPLTHDVFESRRLTEVGRDKKLVTQMGIQCHSFAEYRTAVKLVQDGAVGLIKEVHTWSNKKWGDPKPRPEKTDPVPAGFDWNLWLGVCDDRPFIGGDYYHPGNWRKRLDFGTGTFGDMGCHIYDPVYTALALTAPVSVRSEGDPPNGHNWANDAIVKYVYPGTKFTAGKTVDVTWYDGDRKPPAEVAALVGRALPGQGSVFLGEKGILMLPHVGMPVLLPEKDFKDFAVTKVERVNHYHQFIDAVRGKAQVSAPFDYSGPMTEAILLGGVATRFPKTTLEWDAAAMKFKNLPDADRHVRRTYRKGWEVKGLSDG